jgi:hypothetical protein
MALKIKVRVLTQILSYPEVIYTAIPMYQLPVCFF